MMELFITTSCIAIGIIASGVIIGSFIDDVQDIRRRSQHKAHPYAHRYRTRPIVTAILIASSNTEATTQAVLRLRSSTYRRLEIIIISRARTARLRRLTRQLSTKTQPIFMTTSTLTESVAANNAYRKYGHGSIVTILHEFDQLDASAISRAVWHFSAQENLSRLCAHIHSSTYQTTQSLLQIYAHKLGYLWRKSMNSFESIWPTDTTDLSFYRSNIFLSRHALIKSKVYFANDVIARRPVESIGARFFVNIYNKKRRQLYELGRKESITDYLAKNSISAILYLLLRLSAVYTFIALPVLLTLSIFFAFALHQPLLFFITLLAACTCILIGIWADKTITPLQKIQLSLLAPMSFLPLYLLSWVNSIATMLAALSIRWTGGRLMTKLLRTTAR